MEEWRAVQGFEGYEVSSEGRVRSLDRKHKGRILKPVNSPKGYHSVGLSVAGTVETRMIHRLIADAFLPQIDGKHTVDHINRNKLDNRIINLRRADSFEQSMNQDHILGKTRERYIHLTPLGYYEVKIKNHIHKLSKNFKTLEEAKSFRDTTLLSYTAV